MAALAVVIMLTAYFPYMTYAIPAIAAIAILIPRIECGAKSGIITFLAAAVLSLLFGEMESKLLFVTFLGWYPLAKWEIDRIPKRILRILIKAVIFNLAVFIYYYLCIGLLQVDGAEFELGFRYGKWAFLALANLTFAIYDIGLSRLIMLYFLRFHDRIRSMLK